MNLKARPKQSPPMKGVTLRKGRISFAINFLMAPLMLIAPSIGRAQSTQIITLRLGPDQIGVVKTAEKFSTRLAFREPIKEIICGDLYDPESGIGAFVVQRIDNNVFIKPVAPKGVSNMFVRAGEKGERIYNLSLLIVPIDQVYFLVNIMNPTDIAPEQRVSKQPNSLPAAPPIVTSIKMTDGVPSSAPGSIDNAFLIKFSKMGEPVAPPPPAPNTKSSSRTPGIVANPNSLSREVIRRVKPDYPENARIKAVTGEVIVEITIDQSGKVASAEATSGPLLLRDAAVSAARSWKFSPTTPGQGPKMDVSRITFNFQLPKF